VVQKRECRYYDHAATSNMWINVLIIGGVSDVIVVILSP
jgi:hypothetical protein